MVRALYAPLFHPHSQRSLALNLHPVTLWDGYHSRCVTDGWAPRGDPLCVATVILTGPLRHAKPVSSHRWEENPSPISQSAILLSLALQYFCVAGNTYIPEGSPENQNLWEIYTYTERGRGGKRFITWSRPTQLWRLGSPKICRQTGYPVGPTA